MIFRITIIIALVAALICGAALAKRAVWVHKKVTALTAPASTHYVKANAELPPKSARVRIVLIGDSRIARWPTATVWPENWEVINRGIGGETAAQMAQRFATDAVALDPDVIVIETGINDLTAASFLGDEEMQAVTRNTSETLRRVAGEAAASGHRVLIATIIPAARPDVLRYLVWKEVLRDLISQANSAFGKPLPEHVSVIDFSLPLVADDPQTVAEDYRLDTAHLNEAGYRQLTSVLIDKVQSVLEKDPGTRR